jgi:hypothetical protein
MKVTVVIEDTGSGLQITGSGAAGSATIGASQTMVSPSGDSAGSFDGGAGPAISGAANTAGAPQPFMPVGPQNPIVVAANDDVSAGAAPGAPGLVPSQEDPEAIPEAAPARARSRAVRRPPRRSRG